jgi:hypothetical protein
MILNYRDLQVFTPNDIKPRLDIPFFTIRKGKTVMRFINCAFSIDIETTSTVDNGNEIAFPYCYQVGINNIAYITRDYKVFYNFIKELNNWLQNNDTYIHCCIHNLPYEFTFFCGFLNFTDVFAKENGHPLTCYCGNIRFIDTYQISGLSLEKLSKNYTTTKKIKDLDYKKYRTPHTPMTDEELRYCVDDVIILNEYWNTQEIQRYINKKGVSKIPLTATAKVRMLLKSNVPKEQRKKIQETLEFIYPNEKTMQLLDDAFMGGIVKSNARYTNVVLHNLGCVDLTSSYPASLFYRLYPMSQFVKCNVKMIDDLNNKYCYLLRVKITNLKSTQPIRTLSLSKVKNCVNSRIDNGRLISADSLELTFTDIDFKYLFKFYEFDYEIIYSECAILGRLPKYFIYTLIELYKTKNELKPIYENNPDLKAEYLHTKGLLNALYGCCVTGDKLYNYVYNNGKWDIELNDKYHTFNRDSFLVRQWGVFCSAYSRATLLDGILLCGSDIVYSDTDSCKFLHPEKNKPKFLQQNIEIDKRVKTACAYYNIPFDVMRGIGRWDIEKDVETFKTLGCKRYYHDGDVTISGINNKAFCDYAKIINKTPLEIFTDNIAIPPEYTRKSTSKYYLNNDKSYIYKYIYNGIERQLPIINYIYMCDAPWRMSLSHDYKKLLLFLNVSRETLEREV